MATDTRVVVPGLNGEHYRTHRSVLAVKSISSAIMATAVILTGMTVAPPAATAQSAKQLAPDDLLAVGVSSDMANRLTTDSDPERMSTSFSIDGVLIAEDRRPIANSTIQVSLDPGLEEFYATLSSGGRGHMLPLAVAMTDDAGRFQLSIPALRDITSQLSDAGEVQLVFTSFSLDHSLLFRLQVELPSQPGTAATAAIVDKRVYPAATVQRALAARPVDPSAIPVTDLTLTASTGGTPSPQDFDPIEECNRATEGLPLQNWVWIEGSSSGSGESIATRRSDDG